MDGIMKWKNVQKTSLLLDIILNYKVKYTREKEYNRLQIKSNYNELSLPKHQTQRLLGLEGRY